MHNVLHVSALEPGDGSQLKTSSDESQSTEPAGSESSGGKRKSDFARRVKHPCIIIFDSLAGDACGSVYSILRDYLRVEFKVSLNLPLQNGLCEKVIAINPFYNFCRLDKKESRSNL